MLARAYRNIEPYDAAVTQLRDYFDRLLADGTEWSMPKSDKISADKPQRRATPNRKRRLAN